jgi:DNA-binding transcriptional LysR family regulator
MENIYMHLSSRLLSGVVTFVTVVDAGSFRTAARPLGITPSGVSRGVSRLEEQLGVRLFNRHPRAISLTDEGRRFHDEVRPLVDGITCAAESTYAASGRVTGHLRVQICLPFGHHVLAPNLDPFLKRHPALSIEVEVRDRSSDLIGESFDLAVRFGEPEPSSLVVRKIAETEVLTCAAPKYIEEHGVPRTPLDLLNHQCIHLRSPGSGRIFKWDFLIDGSWQTLPVKSRMVVTDSPSLLAACLGGHGIAQPLEVYSREALRTGKLVRILPEWNQEHYPLYAYMPSRRHPPEKVRAFLSFIEQLIRPDSVEPQT